MATKFRKGQKVICVHYADRPVLFVDSVEGNNLWVKDSNPTGLKSGYWYGPKNWFKRLKRKVK